MKSARKAAYPGAYGFRCKRGTGPHREDEPVDRLRDGAAEHAHARAAGKPREQVGARNGKTARPSKVILATGMRERAEGPIDAAPFHVIACSCLRQDTHGIDAGTRHNHVAYVGRVGVFCGEADDNGIEAIRFVEGAPSAGRHF